LPYRRITSERKLSPKPKLPLVLYRGVTDQTPQSWVRSASFGLAVLSFINLFSYLDRYIVSALIESLKHSELALSDADLGSLMSGFLVVYTVTAPVFGALGDLR
jgi:sugar phosphate permease